MHELLEHFACPAQADLAAHPVQEGLEPLLVLSRKKRGGSVGEDGMKQCGTGRDGIGRYDKGYDGTGRNTIETGWDGVELDEAEHGTWWNNAECGKRDRIEPNCIGGVGGKRPGGVRWNKAKQNLQSGRDRMASCRAE